MHDLFMSAWLWLRLEDTSLNNIVWLDRNNIRGLIHSVNNKYKISWLHDNKYNYIINTITQ